MGNPLALEGEPVARVVLNARVGVSLKPWQRLATWVQGGGRLLVLVDQRAVTSHPDAVLRVLGCFGVRGGFDFVKLDRCIDSDAAHVHRVFRGGARVVPLGPMVAGEIVEHDLGAGRVVFVTNAELFSRKLMGRVFKKPYKAEMVLYRLANYIVSSLVADTPSDKGTVSGLIGDFAKLSGTYRRSSQGWQVAP